MRDRASVGIVIAPARTAVRALAAGARPAVAVLAAFGFAPAFATGALVEAAKTADGSAALELIADGADVNEAEADGTTPLHWAVYHDDVALVERLLAAGASVAAVNRFGSTPFAEAAVVGNADVLRMLLEAGADVHAPNTEGQTALMVVARSNDLDAARLLLEHGADVDAHEQWKEQTALMWAAAQSRPDMVALLIEHGADVDARSVAYDWKRQVTAEPRAKHLPSGGFTPLLFAARQGCLDCAKRLVAAGADVDLPDPDAVTPLLMALLNGHFDTAKFLVEAGANVDKWDWWGRNPLYAAVDYSTLPRGGRPDRPSLDDTAPLAMIELLLAEGANPNAQLKLLQPYRNIGADRGADPILGIGTTPLLRAAKAGDLPVIRLLLEHGALPDLPQVDAVTPLMAAAGLRSYAIDTRGRFKTEQEAIESARLILDAGAAVNLRDSLGQTALHGAAFQGWNGLVEFLAGRGADVAAKDRNGMTPIDAAMGRMRGVGRGATDVNPHPDTAALLERLIAED